MIKAIFSARVSSADEYFGFAKASSRRQAPPYSPKLHVRTLLACPHNDLCIHKTIPSSAPRKKRTHKGCACVDRVNLSEPLLFPTTDLNPADLIINIPPMIPPCCFRFTITTITDSSCINI